MGKFVDLTGHRFGKVTVIELAPKDKHGNTMWSCQCDCGNKRNIRIFHLRRKNISCGCNVKTHGESSGSRFLGNKKGSKEWIAWQGMIGRCMNPNNKKYKDYGGRGIKICPEWDLYKTFLSDVGRAPSKSHSLERINVNGNYEPKNVCWVTNKMQSINKRNSKQHDVNVSSGFLSFGG